MEGTPGVASRQAARGVQLVVPKFKAPAAKANKRTGKGDRHRPHAFVKGASVPVVVMLILVSLLSIWLSFDKVFGSQSPDNYSLIEIIAARSWCAPMHCPHALPPGCLALACLYPCGS